MAWLQSYASMWWVALTLFNRELLVRFGTRNSSASRMVSQCVAVICSCLYESATRSNGHPIFALEARHKSSLRKINIGNHHPSSWPPTLMIWWLHRCLAPSSSRQRSGQWQSLAGPMAMHPAGTCSASARGNGSTTSPWRNSKYSSFMGGFLGTVLTALRSPIGVKGDGQNWRQAQQQCQAQAIFLPWGLIEEVKHKVITISFTSMASQKIDCFNQTFSKKTSYLENPVFCMICTSSWCLASKTMEAINPFPAPSRPFATCRTTQLFPRVRCRRWKNLPVGPGCARGIVGMVLSMPTWLILDDRVATFCPSTQ